MATVQNPFRAPPGTVIRPDGMPAGRGGRWAMWLTLIVLALAGISYVVEHAPRAADDDDDDTVVRSASVERRAPIPEPEPEPEPEPIVDPLLAYLDAAPATPDIAVYGLTIDEVRDAISKIEARIDKCGERPHATGVVIVEVAVMRSGHVSDVTVAETPDRKLGACVAKAIERARFPRSPDGAQFTIPFGF